MDAEEKNWQEVKDRFRIGDPVKGRVIEKVSRGYWIDINAGFPALLENNQAPAAPAPEDPAPVGSTVKASIIGFIETPEKQIRLMQKP